MQYLLLSLLYPYIFLSAIPITLHLDHGGDFEICKACIDNGFSSVMFDGSSRPYEENIKISQQVVEYAHSRNDYVSVECELGVLAGVEDEVSSEVAHYTKPEEVIPVLEKGLTSSNTVIMDFAVAKEECVYPMVPAGAAITEMLLS